MAWHTLPYCGDPHFSTRTSRRKLVKVITVGLHTEGETPANPAVAAVRETQW